MRSGLKWMSSVQKLYTYYTYNTRAVRSTHVRNITVVMLFELNYWRRHQYGLGLNAWPSAADRLIAYASRLHGELIKYCHHHPDKLAVGMMIYLLVFVHTMFSQRGYPEHTKRTVSRPFLAIINNIC